MSSIQVSKTETGWTINKGGKSFTVTDKNGDGKWDKEDVCKELSGSGNALNAEEIFEAKYKILQQGDGVTDAEMAQYAKFKEQQAAKEKREEQKQQLQQYNQPQAPKKGGFWNTLGRVSTVVLGGVSGFLGMLTGFGGGANAWAFNNTANDWNVRGFSGYSSGMLNTSTAMGGMNFGGGNPYGNYGNDLGAIIEAAQSEQAERNAKMEEWVETSKIKAEENKAKREKETAAKGIKSLYENSQKNDDEKVMDSANADKLDKMYEVGKEDYSEEEIKQADKIEKFKHVPSDHIADSTGGDKAKLDPGVAKELNEKLEKYKKETNESIKQGILSIANYDELQKIMGKATLTEADITKIKEILKKPAPQVTE